MEVLIKGKLFLSILVGIRFKIKVDGLEETIVVSSERSTGEKQYKYKSGSRDTSKATILDDTSVIIVGRIL